MAKSKFDIYEIKQKLNEEQYAKAKESDFKVTMGEKVMHIIVALIAYAMLVSLTISLYLSNGISMLIYGVLTLALIFRIVMVIKMTQRAH